MATSEAWTEISLREIVLRLPSSHRARVDFMRLVNKARSADHLEELILDCESVMRAALDQDGREWRSLHGPGSNYVGTLERLRAHLANRGLPRAQCRDANGEELHEVAPGIYATRDALLEMSEPTMRAIMGDEAFEADVAAGREAIDRALRRHRDE